MSVKIENNYLWTNEHNNVSKQVLHRYQVKNGGTPVWEGGLKGVQQMIAEAKSRNERLRSYGGKWSLSDVAICNDCIHDSKPLVYFVSIGENSIAGKPLYESDPLPLSKRLYYFQSGCQINQINNVLEKEKQLSLATTGASNGQTIAGAVSTGTHGSALKIGAMQDYVRAIHIVTSESKHFILQPKTNPVVNDSFYDFFKAEPLNDDNLFYSALVSFGSFGVIIGLVVETVSLFMFETYCRQIDYNKAESVYQHLVNFNHSSNSNLTNFLNQFSLPSDEDPYHLEIVANPYSSTQNAFLKVMYKRVYDKNKLSPPPDGSSTRVGDDILSLIGLISSSAGAAVPLIINNLFSQVAQVQTGYTQTPRNIFGDSTIYKPKKGCASVELGVPIDKAAQAVNLVLSTAKQANFPGLLGIRFVKNSSATLAFTRFKPLTCTIELPGLNSDNTQTFYRQVFSELDNAKIHFTLHWGQEGDYSPKRLSLMYGDDLQKWVNERNKFLSDPLQRYMFTNDFMKRCGLSEAQGLTDGGVIA